MKLYLLRHTKTKAEKGTVYGNMNIDVADSFHSENQIIKKQLKKIHYDKIYSSNLKRCIILAEHLKKEEETIIYDSRLQEMNFGIWEGKKWKDIEDSEDATDFFNDFVNTPCPEGESFTDLMNRIKEFLYEIFYTCFDEKILIVCHAGVIRAFYAIINQISGQDVFNIEVNYGQLIELEVTKL